MTLDWQIATDWPIEETMQNSQSASGFSLQVYPGPYADVRVENATLLENNQDEDEHGTFAYLDFDFNSTDRSLPVKVYIDSYLVYTLNFG